MNVTNFISKITDPPTLSSRYWKLRELSESESMSVQGVTQIVRVDQSFASRILRAANSPFYSFSAKIETIEKAVGLLGYKEVINLALTLDVMSNFRGLKPQDTEKFWRHSVLVASLSREVAGKLCRAQKDKVYAIALLHDIGFIMLAKNFPKEYTAVMNLLSRNRSLSIFAAEKLAFDSTHLEISCEVMKHWRFSSIYCDTLLAINNPDGFQNGSENELLAKSIYIAHKLVESNSDCFSFDRLTAISGLDSADIAEDYDFVKKRSEGLLSILSS